MNIDLLELTDAERMDQLVALENLSFPVNMASHEEDEEEAEEESDPPDSLDFMKANRANGVWL